MRFIKKLLIKLLADDLYQISIVEAEKLNEWLKRSYKDPGFKHYYTMRKKSLLLLLENGVEGKEQWEALGRLKELKALTINMSTSVKRATKEEKKEVVSQKKI